MTNVLPFRLPRDRVILYRSAPLRRTEPPTGFCLVWVPADDPTARVVVWDGADYGEPSPCWRNGAATARTCPKNWRAPHDRRD